VVVAGVGVYDLAVEVGYFYGVGVEYGDVGETGCG